jgi:hypothetical protein
VGLCVLVLGFMAWAASQPDPLISESVFLFQISRRRVPVKRESGVVTLRADAHVVLVSCVPACT